MKYFQISVLCCFILSVAVIHAQDYYENMELEENGKFGHFNFEINNENKEHLRFRRHGDDENLRHRRQGGHGGGHEGVTGPVHTFVKTDEHAHFKWGVRHHVGHEYAGGR